LGSEAPFLGSFVFSFKGKILMKNGRQRRRKPLGEYVSDFTPKNQGKHVPFEPSREELWAHAYKLRKTRERVDGIIYPPQEMREGYGFEDQDK
jgi:hypothetical protein